MAAIVGGTANALGDASAQIYSNWDDTRDLSTNLNDFNKTQSTIAFGYGAASGASTPFTGPMGAIAVNSVLGGAQQVTTDMVVNGESFDEAFNMGDTGTAATMGAVGGIVQGTLPNQLKHVSSSRLNGEVFDSIGYATGKDALANGGSVFASNTDAWLQSEQLLYLSGGRYLTGASVGNVTTPESNECGNIFSCTAETISSWWNGDNNE